MQVLVALYRAGGAVISKDDLAQSCWEGRVVGEDAINRVLSRLRRVSEGIAKGIFHVETVTRVGYRLVIEGKAAGSPIDNMMQIETPGWAIRRRGIIAGAGVALAGAAGGWYLYQRRVPVPSDLAVLLDRAQAAMQYHAPEQTAAAVGLLRGATRLYPERAEGWGKLAIAYHQQGWSSPRSDSGTIMDYGESAAKRALELDPGNVDGLVFMAVPGKGYYQNWLEYDRACRVALVRFPEHFVAARTCAAFLFSVGRIRDSLKATEYLVKLPTPSPQVMAMHAQKLWAAGRVDEAATLFNSALYLWPRHPTVWFACHRFLTYAGKPLAAEAMVADVNARPVGISDEYFEFCLASSRAVRTGSAQDAATALQKFPVMANTNPAGTEDAAVLASASGQMDVAFDYLDAIYAPSTNDTAEGFRGHSGRLTYFLFIPPMKAVRADDRFDQVTVRTGLKEYWRKAGVTPDYLT
jgi:tetratricopeptide (TPR) repeat protein